MENIIRFYRQLIKNPAYYLTLFVALLINSFIWLLIVLRLPASATWIPLHFNTNFGIDWIGPWIKIIYYPSIALAIIIINILVASFIKNENKYAIGLLIWSALFIQIITLLSLIILIINYF